MVSFSDFLSVCVCLTASEHLHGPPMQDMQASRQDVWFVTAVMFVALAFVALVQVNGAEHGGGRSSPSA